MVRAALLVVALAFGGGGGFLDMVTVLVAEDVEAGAIWDPFGGPEDGSSGSDAGNDAGSIWDPWG